MTHLFLPNPVPFSYASDFIGRVSEGKAFGDVSKMESFEAENVSHVLGVGGV